MSVTNILTEPDVITVEQFLEMDLPDSCQWLLVHGTVVSVTHPRFPHSRIQSNIHAMLLRLVEGSGALVFSELPYELTQIDGHKADVAVLTAERAAEAAKTDYIVKGAPELVVEVMSRSNLPYDIDELERECLASGCLMFWKVVLKHRKRLDYGTPDYSVRVGRMVEGRLEHEIYRINDLVPVELPGVSGKISASDIFAGALPA